MRYDDKDRESSNVEDRRSEQGGMFGGRGIGIPIPIGGGGFSMTTMLIIGALMLLFGFNPLDLLRGMQPGGGQVQMPPLPRMEPGPRRQAGNEDSPLGIPGQKRANVPAEEDAMKKFIGRVLADTEDVWGQVFKSFGKNYAAPKLILFSGATRTGCGQGVTQMGPFYCPLDQKVYIDLQFYDELKRRFNAPGDFAQAYVVAHEVGHHVQKLLGIADRVQELKERSDERTANAIQVRMELQADCLAGVWANLAHELHSRIQDGDIEEGLNAASQIGDDMIQKKMTGRVVPDAFTHGSAAQRTRWFKAGLSSGDIKVCDTFSTSQL
jgi:predicted metalloprotease